MEFGGLQKLSCLDYPGLVACTVFTKGCNLRCPFCHNAPLVDGFSPESIPEEEILAYLKKRQGILEGVTITGGEPLIHPGLTDFLEKVKALGYQVKLDTNGSKPDFLRQLVEKGLVDKVAMDIKNAPTYYGMTIGRPGFDIAPIEETKNYLLSSPVDYEFRTTVVEQFHNDESISAIGSWLSRLSPEKKARRLFLQPYADRDSVLVHGLHTPSAEKLRRFKEILTPYANFVDIRGTD